MRKKTHKFYTDCTFYKVSFNTDGKMIITKPDGSTEPDAGLFVYLCGGIVKLTERMPRSRRIYRKTFINLVSQNRRDNETDNA